MKASPDEGELQEMQASINEAFNQRRLQETFAVGAKPAVQACGL
jgi:hypothetical protein